MPGSGTAVPPVEPPEVVVVVPPLVDDDVVEELVVVDEEDELVDGQFFTVQLCVSDLDSATGFAAAPLLVLPLAGSPRIDAQPLAPGQCGLAPGLSAIELAPGDRVILVQPKH